MPNKMLIDASHPEETRVVVVRGNRIEEFDFESQDKKQLRGNIYLARVTRVEPSLQAAFVEYGGNRHGFLAFSEIHPDYYQIPVADRQALLKAEAEEAKAADEEADEHDSGRSKRRRRNGKRSTAKEDAATPAEEFSENGHQPAVAEEVHDNVISEKAPPANGNGANGNGLDDDENGEIDIVGAGDALDEAQVRRRPVRRDYKIQEVIKRRQILLVQVVKEERGSKGAALTTYLSLAGRYSVLMPNTARGGGISRKITNPADRKRLKEIVKSLNVPEGMGVILRTAGANRTKAEIKRDYDYLMRLWERVRSVTLESIAPSLVYEEGSLIKRSVRDLYNREINQILVAGEEGYREAKDFMRMLMPSHAKVVQPYRDSVPIFARNGIEAQLDKMLQPQVTLKSGGYIIINQTEALVAIDVNSGRSTKEHSIEDTALQTNLEAAEEVARQLRLRDLAGLIVIDFIDMEESRNNRAVEKRLKECLKNDRARIQVGRISHFGLLEMSRQRIRSSVLESTMQPCAHCGGTGYQRSDSSVALMVVRAIEEHLLKESRYDITVRTSSSAALYLLNQKRSTLMDLENRFGVAVTIEADEHLSGQHYSIVKGLPSTHISAAKSASLPEKTPETAETEDTSSEDELDGDHEAAASEEENGGAGRKRRRKRRRRGGRDKNGELGADAASDDLMADEAEEPSPTEEAAAAPRDEAEPRKKRHRGKRGGKRNRREGAGAEEESAAEVTSVSSERPDEDARASQLSESPAESEASPAIAESVAQDISEPAATDASEPAATDLPEPAAAAADSGPAAVVSSEPAAGETSELEKAEPAPKPRRRTRARKEVQEVSQEDKAGEAPSEADAGQVSSSEQVQASVSAEDAEQPAAKPGRRRPREEKVEEKEPVASSTQEPVVSSLQEGEEPLQRRTGWWQRKSFF
ncbi:ribonuclease E/G [Chelativorans sp. Marseille-P2723]|uniref:Rne/Rng family ribonuclease n=1 Tax=Chelativorans sp. Marseille-P2723 TaxID=2709133 RepID=UPI00156ED5F0|nr:ribonuclease E/G [Chelativorans sp. Marseille-P2723]